MKHSLGKLAITRVREGDGMMPLQFAGRVRHAERYFSYVFL